MTDLAAAWDAVDDNTPECWYVGKPDFEERYDQWSMYAFDPGETPIQLRSGRCRVPAHRGKLRRSG